MFFVVLHTVYLLVILGATLIIIKILIVPLLLLKSKEESSSEEGTTSIHHYCQTYHDVCNTQEPSLSIPFFYLPPSCQSSTNDKDPFRNLAKALHQFQDDIDRFISSMVVNVEIARKTEWEVFAKIHNDSNNDYGRYHRDENNKQKRNNDNNYNNNNEHDNTNLFSSKLEARIRKIAFYSEQNYFILEKILKPFHFVMGLPLSTSLASSPYSDSDDHHVMSCHHDSYNDWIDLSEGQYGDNVPSSSYDSAMQVLTHIIRDYSDLGIEIRHNLYDWIISNLLSHLNKVNVDGPVLVPGAGLGRLALEISKNGFHVEANEISIVMATAAYQLLHHNVNGVIYPFVTDHQINEVDSNSRYQAVQFPDESFLFEHNNHDVDDDKERNRRLQSSLSYTIGDFIELYSTTERRGKYGSIITCFFIDTASNIYEYLLVIRNILSSGGVWINVGPLQWHGNSKLNPSGDELRMMIESLGFTIHSWEVDEEALNYRHDDGNEQTRYTKFEGYKPLRFIVSLSSRSLLRIDHISVKKQIYEIRASLSMSKKKSNSFKRNENADNYSNIIIEELN